MHKAHGVGSSYLKFCVLSCSGERLNIIIGWPLGFKQNRVVLIIVE